MNKYLKTMVANRSGIEIVAKMDRVHATHVGIVPGW